MARGEFDMIEMILRFYEIPHFLVVFNKNTQQLEHSSDLICQHHVV